MHHRKNGVKTFFVVCFVVLLVTGFYLHCNRLIINGEQETESENEDGALDPDRKSSLDDNADQLVSDFYSEQRLDRDRLRSQQVDTYLEIMNNPDTSAENRQMANNKLLLITEETTLEKEVEALIKAKDFADAIMFLQTDSAHVLIKSQEISATQAAKIGDIVARHTGLPLENIIIDARP